MKRRTPSNTLLNLMLRGIVVVATLLTELISPTAYGSDWNITQLMELLAQNQGGRTTFTEKKYMAVLDRPLLSSGELLYKAPNHLEKRILSPKPENFILDGDIVTIQRGAKKHTLNLHDYPKISAFIESIRGTLAGDRAALERSYRLSLDGTRSHWTLMLSPTSHRLGDVIRSILVNGEQNQVLSIEINQTDGDRSVMTIGKPSDS